MKDLIEPLLTAALDRLGIASDQRGAVVVERARGSGHGDFASNAALVLARAAATRPRELAERLVAALPDSPLIERCEIAGPGFINFFFTPAAYHQQLHILLEAGEAWGRQSTANDRRILVEFVSANPTGPLHVGHGRGAAYGDSLARILAATGYRVEREYYVNDAGRQADILAVSVWLAALTAAGEKPVVPSAAYPGDYIARTAAALPPELSARLHRPWAEVANALPPDAPEGDKEAHIDALIGHAKTLLGEDYPRLRGVALATQTTAIRDTLERFHVGFDRWFSEASLEASGEIAHALKQLSERGHTYESEGAVWLRTSALGDEKDRVLKRSDGSTTYFASDVAYHLDKLERGYDLLLDVWGADHHGYVARVAAAIEALTGRGDAFEARLIQFVTLSSGRMGKRSGNFVTLDDLIGEAGTDATRFFYLSRSNDQHLEFDVELARSHSNDNPMYYIQYAHARIASVFRQLEEKGLSWEPAAGADALAPLTAPSEFTLILQLSRLPEVIAAAATERAPHLLVHYLGELAQAFHVWYNSSTFLVDEGTVRNARLSLAQACRQTITAGLDLLGVSAPERM
ncbi:MAG: arginine--tRNA ligase [Gammaproteobacteria bacterium]